MSDKEETKQEDLTEEVATPEEVAPEPVEETAASEESAAMADAPAPTEETVTVSRKEFDELKALVYGVADKGRLLAHEQKASGGKHPTKVKLSSFAGGTIIGWRTVKDKLVQHPTTGKTVGEEQEYEVLVLKSDGSTEKIGINGYPQFSEARYGERIEAQVLGKTEDYDGKITFKVQLPDSRVIDLDGRFVN